MKTIYVCGGLSDSKVDNVLEASYLTIQAHELGILFARLDNKVKIYHNIDAFLGGLIWNCLSHIDCSNAKAFQEKPRNDADKRFAKEAKHCDLMIALPGGLETLTEVTAAIQRGQQVAIIDPCDFYAGFAQQIAEGKKHGFIKNTNFKIFHGIHQFAKKFIFDEKLASRDSINEGHEIVQKLREYDLVENQE